MYVQYLEGFVMSNKESKWSFGLCNDIMIGRESQCENYLVLKMLLVVRRARDDHKLICGFVNFA